MRPSLIAIGVLLLLLIISGFRLDGLPFRPDAAFSDAVTAHYPAAYHLRQSVTSGEILPLWWELNMGGQPFAANPLNKTAYPVQWLAVLLPPMLHLNLLLIGHLVLGGLGMWTWARRLGLGTSAAAAAAVAFMVAPRMAAHAGAGHLDLVYALAWFPWLMWRAHLWCDTPSSLRKLLLTSATAALMLLADVRLSLFALPIATGYSIWRCAVTRELRRLAAGLWLVPLGLLLTLPLTMPLLLWQPYLSRAALSAAEAGVFSLEIGQLAGLLLPPPANNVETLTFVGLTVLGLAAIALLAQPRRLWGWAALCVGVTLYALGSHAPAWQTLTEVIPPLRWFRVPARAWLVAALVLPLLAAYGLQTLLDFAAQRRRAHRARLRLMAAIGLIIALACGGFTLLSLPDLTASGLHLLIFGGAIMGVALLTLTRRLAERPVAIIVSVLMAIELLVNAHAWLEWRSAEDWQQPAALAELLAEQEADRIYSPTYSLPQQTAIAHNLPLFGGVDPFQLQGLVDALADASGVRASGYSVVQPPLMGAQGDDLSTANQHAQPNTQVLATWQVSHVVAPYPIQHPRLQLIEQIDGILVYRNLDYTLTLPHGGIPRWPSGWSALPSSALVAQFNDQTRIAYAIGGLAWLVSLAFMIGSAVRTQ